MGIMENKMETTIIIYWGYNGIMENKHMLGFYGDNGKENGNYYNILG